MALIKCVDCGKDISDKAKSCPNCGCPVEESVTVDTSSQLTQESKDSKTRGKKKCIFASLCLIVLCIISVFIFNFVDLDVLYCNVFGCEDKTMDTSGCQYDPSLFDSSANYVEIINDYINVRDNADSYGAKLGIVCKGEKYNVLDYIKVDGVLWYRIEYKKDYTGYIISEYHDVDYVEYFEQSGSQNTTSKPVDKFSSKKTTTNKSGGVTTTKKKTTKATSNLTTKATTKATNANIKTTLEGKNSIYSEYGTSCSVASASLTSKRNSTTGKVEITLSYKLTMNKKTGTWDWCKFDAKVYDSDNVLVKRGIMYEEQEVGETSAGKTYLNFESDDNNFRVVIVPYK